VEKIIAGIDEVGRGPLAGPLVLGIVACSKESIRKNLTGIKDSKKTTPTKRIEWYKKIKNNPEIIFKTISITPKQIDKYGLSPSIKQGIARLIEKLDKNPHHIFLDGSLFAPKKYKQTTVIKGDEKIPIISAASIIAKVKRDNHMIRIHKKFPNYRFDLHKGYGTKLHIKLIKKHGLSEIHRTTFLKKDR